MSGRRPKTPWYTQCRRGQERWKATSPTLPEAARAPGRTWVEGAGGRKTVGPFPVCLPLGYAADNLLPGVREQALARFARHGIAWHHGTPGPDGEGWPSTHLLDSQVQCVNVLLDLAAGEDRGLAFARQAEPEAVALADVEDGSPVAFEWSGSGDLLGERRGRPFVRGRYTTSVDAFLVAERADGGRTALLVEWKFTESYDRPIPVVSRRGTDRRVLYRDLYLDEAGPFHEHPPLDTFFHEPHYQLLRLVLLAQAVVEAGEHDVDRAIVVHAVPAGNRSLLRTVPEGLRVYGATVPEVWGRLVGGGRVGWSWVDTGPWLARGGEVAGRYGGPGLGFVGR